MKRIGNWFFGLVLAMVGVTVIAQGAERPEPLLGTAFVSRAKQYLQERAKSPLFSAAILVAQKDQVLLREAYGKADYELDVQLRPDHIFPVASLTKSLTATAAMKLREEGLLDFSKSVCEYVKEAPPGWQAVTVEHLLRHTSGLPDLFEKLEAVPVQDTGLEIKRVLLKGEGLQLKAVPGETYAYNNFNYVLLAHIMERVSGQLWETLLQSRVFGPAGMTDSMYDDVWAIIPRRVHGYGVKDQRLKFFPYQDHAAYAAGGLDSTLDDLQRWHNALWKGKLVSKTSLREAFTPGLGNYGFGWEITSQFGKHMHGHSGGNAGFNSHIVFYEEAELLIVVLSNVKNVNAGATACDLAALAFQVTPAPTGDAAWLMVDPKRRCGRE